MNYVMGKKESASVLCGCYLLTFGFTYLFYSSISVSIFTGFLGIKLKSTYVKWKTKKQKTEIKNQFKDVLYQISSAIATGRNMYQALEEAENYIIMIYGENSQMALELKKMIYEIGNNRDSDERVIKEFAYRLGIPEIENFADVYGICKETGGNLNEAISAAAITLTERMEIENEINKVMAQKVFEGRIVAIMPCVIILFLNMCSPGYLDIMYSSMMGRLIMTLTMIVYIAAVIWLLKLTEVYQ